MKSVFADSSYWIALLNPRDDLHDKAVAVSASLGIVRYVTSQLVLTEVLNYFAAHGVALRRAAIELVQQLHIHPQTTVIPQSPAEFQDAFALYAERDDKTWGLTDCASFQVRHRELITEALSHDKDFEQAGFKALLREPTR